ncbi:MAG: GAP family protein [Candidatus Woesearchaeota archaeon]
MLRLLGVVISIGLADSLNPTTLGPALFLASRKSPRRQVLQFTAGTFAVFLLGGLVLTLGPGAAIIALVPHPNATTRYILETIAGTAMLVFGLVLWRRRERIRKRAGDGSRGSGRAVSGATRKPWILGATIALVELPTAFPYFAAIAAIVGSGLGLTRQIALVVIYNVCFVLPLLGIVALLTVFDERAVQILDRIRRYLRYRWPVLVSVIALIAGVFVIALGVTGLIGQAPGHVGNVSRRLRHLITR